MTHAYPSDLVLSIDDENRKLVVTNMALFQEIEELNVMVDAQGARIVELEGTVIDEWTRAEAASNEFQRTRARLARVVKEVRDRAVGILADTTMLIEEVIDAVESSVHEGTPEEEPFDEDPEEDVQTGGLATNYIRIDESFDFCNWE